MPLAEAPLVSVVTPSFNMAQYLPETIESVLGQDYPRIEYIVADGGSTDGTLAILERHRDRLRFTSGPDGGPSDALFHAFRQAHGEILAWLNADDILRPGAIRAAVEHLRQHPEVDIVYGEGWWMDENGATIRRYPSPPFDPKLLETDCFICQPAAFLRASAYRRFEVNPQIACSFDYDLWIRMAKAGVRFSFLPEHLANSRMHRGAKTMYERHTVFRESMTLLKQHYGYVPLAWIFGYTSFRLDGRDQFFQPLRPSAWKYLASLPVGLWYNPKRPLRFAAEWLSTLSRGVRRQLRPVGPPISKA